MTGQHVAVDGHLRRFYNAAIVAVALFLGCAHSFRSIAPADLTEIPASTVEEWVDRYAPRRPMRMDLRWKLRNDRGAAGGRAAVRVGPPDTLRLDFRGPFGRSGAALVVGDSGLWAKPESGFHDVIRAAQLFWAALGLPRRPPPGAAVFGAVHPDRRSWRYAMAQDTFDFIEIHAAPARLLAEMRRAGTIVGLAEARFDATGRRVASARMDFPAAESRFVFTVEAIDSTAAFGPDAWRQP